MSDSEDATTRFVILHHQMPHDSDRATHWDLMIQQGDSLRTWALERQPSIGHEQTANALPDHRLAYLDYEGPVSGNRGTVSRWDEGECRVVSADDQLFVADLAGKKMTMRVEIRAVDSDQRRIVRISGSGIC